VKHAFPGKLHKIQQRHPERPLPSATSRRMPLNQDRLSDLVYWRDTACISMSTHIPQPPAQFTNCALSTRHLVALRYSNAGFQVDTTGVVSLQRVSSGGLRGREVITTLALASLRLARDGLQPVSADS